MNWQCWPSIKDPGIVCACGNFKISGVTFEEAKRRYREHVVAFMRRENERVHQDRT